MRKTIAVNLVTGILLLAVIAAPIYVGSWWWSSAEPAQPVVLSEAPVSEIVEASQTEPALDAHYDSVSDYFKAGNPNATTYRLGEPVIKRKSFSAKQRAEIHRENGGVCQVCGSAGPLEVEHWRGIQNGGGNERANLRSLCVPCHNAKTKMDNSLRRKRGRLLKQQ